MTSETTSTERASWQRTHTCGELRAAHVGETVTLNGWVNARRDHGGIYFLDLRDRYGVTQVVMTEEIADSVQLGPEYVLSVTGTVAARDAAQVNSDRATGEIELATTSIEVLSASPTPPMEVTGGSLPAVETRLRYRYIDLRREPMQRAIQHRSRFILAMRRAFEAEDFLEIETPMMTRATPEGARDYLVPSRVHPQHFYALPQSPQIFKQILMVSGFDRYFQVAKCFRDEDLRADRQPEFTQLDMEMSFVEEEDVFEIWERVLVRTLRESMDIELPVPFPRMRYSEAMERYGVDKPDTRFGMELTSIDEWAAGSEFKVFSSVVASGGRVLGIVVPKAHTLSRKQITALESVVKEYGAKGLAWWKAAEDGGAGPLARFASDAASARDLMQRLGAAEGDTCLFVADTATVARRALGELRNHLGRELGLIPEGVWNFLWVTHFPMFERDVETGAWNALHHPFTAPEGWSLEGDPGELCSRAYDLVLNGWELGSGSIRIHRGDIQEQVFNLLGISAEDQERKFGFLLEALKYGAPPHGGFALGLDRVVALLFGLDNIRDVIAFPKTATAADLMCGAPSPVDPEQLAEVHVRVVRAPGDPA
jgi:aspartyl-tRNA synthetase